MHIPNIIKPSRIKGRPTVVLIAPKNAAADDSAPTSPNTSTAATQSMERPKSRQKAYRSMRR